MCSSALSARLLTTLRVRDGRNAEHGARRAARARSRSRRLMAALAAGAVTAGLAHPGSSSASTCQSLPGTTSFADGRYDAVDANGVPDPTGQAPDITSVDVAVTASCQLIIGATVERHASPPYSLSEGETIGFLLDVDSNRATGAPPTGADRQIMTYGNADAPEMSRLGTWTGGGFSYVELPAPLPWGRQTVSFAALGIAAPRTVRITAIAGFVVGGTSWFESTPGDDSPFAVRIAFAGGYSPPSPWPEVPQAHRVACTVPEVRRRRAPDGDFGPRAAGRDSSSCAIGGHPAAPSSAPHRAPAERRGRR
jgi:hypothetical protein